MNAGGLLAHYYERFIMKTTQKQWDRAAQETQAVTNAREAESAGVSVVPTFVVPTFTAQIYIGRKVQETGETLSLSIVTKVCQEYVDDVGLCVSITPCEFVYSNGRESGANIGLIHYPRFPSGREVIRAHALELASRLRVALSQSRVSVVMPDETVMLGDTKDKL